MPLGPYWNPKKSCYHPQFTDAKIEAPWWRGSGAFRNGSRVGGAAANRSRQHRLGVELGLSPGALSPEAQHPAAGLPSIVQISCDVRVTVPRAQPSGEAHIFFEYKCTRESCNLKGYYLLTVFFFFEKKKDLTGFSFVLFPVFVLFLFFNARA